MIHSLIDVALAFGAIGAGLGGFAFVRRFGGSTALAELERANKILTRRVRELEDRNRQLTAQVATLTTQTNIALALEPVIVAMQSHEDRATKRSEAHIILLELIAERLGPDPEKAAA